MNKAFLIFALAFIIIDSQAQTASDSISRRGQAVFVELLGPGGIFSANYDTRFTSKPGGIGIRTGISYTKIEDASIFTLPVQMNYLLGKDEKYFEIGLGAAAGSAPTAARPTPRCCYRTGDGRRSRASHGARSVCRRRARGRRSCAR